MITKVIYLQELHKIYLLQPEIDYITVIYLIEAYMAKYNIRYHREEYETKFLHTAHDPLYNSFEAFCVLCEMFMDFADAGAFHDRLKKQLQKQDVLLISHPLNGTRSYAEAV